jgi:phenylalanyl-tRNA synthetase beta chain
LGLRSEAVTRFEKGIDPALTITAIQKAATMITDIAAGELASDIIDLYPEPERTRIVNLDMGSIKRRLGVEIEKSKIVDILRSLNFEFTDLEKVAAESINRSDVASTVQVHVPSYRRDIRAQEDLLEEIGRLFGYEYIPTTLPLRNLEIPRYNGLGALVTHLKKVSATSGLNEIYTYTMVGEELYRKAMVETKPLHKIMNPISPELAMIRTQLVPSILEKVELNHPRYSDFGLFEVSKVALTKEDKQTGLPEQPFLWAAARVGEDEHTVYRQLKYSIEQINSQICSHKLQITEETKGIPSYYHPGKTASVRLEDTIIGYIGVAHPQVVENFGLGRETLVIAELEVEPLLALTTAPKSAFKSLSNFPTVQRDISFWQQPHTYVQHTLDAINKLELELLKAVEVIDTYSEGDKTSTTLRVTMQSDTHTLEQSEITDVIETIQQVISKLKHELR